MKISLKNIAKVKQADIEINGITVIAGANNTGKSTVGKALYSVFNSCFDLKARIEVLKITSLASEFKRITYEKFHPFAIDSVTTYYDLASRFYKKSNEIKEFTADSSVSTIMTFKDFLKGEEDGDDFVHFSAYNSRTFIKNLNEKLLVTSSQISQAILEKTLASEFNEQVSNIFTEEHSNISLTIKNNTVEAKIKDNKVIEFEPKLNTQTVINYIDTPYIIDDIAQYSAITFFGSHKDMLTYNLQLEKTKTDILDDILIEQSLQKINEKINNICKGNIKLEGKQFFYSEEGSNKQLNIKNLSTGVKTFTIIKRLLQNGNIKNNGSIILDEPEIHLHPEWQLVFAELLVLLQKTFNLHILLNTHSPYFLRAIQVYSAKHEIADKCKYYLSRLEDDSAYIDDVSNDIEKIFKSLARPFQILENQEQEIYEN